MQKTEENLHLELAEAEKKHNESLAALEKERGDLQQNLALVETNLTQTRSQLTTLETEAEGLRHRNQSFRRSSRQASRVMLMRHVQDQRKGDRRKETMLEAGATGNRPGHLQRTLLDKLQAALDEKEKREMELLGEKEQAVTQVT